MEFSATFADLLFKFLNILVAVNVALFVGNIALRFFWTDRKPKTKNDKIHLMSIIGSGGHTTEMIKLLNGLGEHYALRTYIIANTDKMGQQKVLEFEEQRASGSFTIHYIPRSREVGQSYLASVWTTLAAFWCSIAPVWKNRPDVVLCNGPGTGLPICVVAYLMDLMRIAQIHVIYVESICRVKKLSLTGSLLYHTRMFHSFVVQWPELCEAYPRTKYIGRLV